LKRIEKIEAPASAQAGASLFQNDVASVSIRRHNLNRRDRDFHAHWQATTFNGVIVVIAAIVAAGP
jgi:hypothetical protein